MSLSSSSDVVALLQRAWPEILAECRSVLASELHYQALIYHILRQAGAPRGQVGMNVKQWIEAPITEHFRAIVPRNHEAFRGGFEAILARWRIVAVRLAGMINLRRATPRNATFTGTPCTVPSF